MNAQLCCYWTCCYTSEEGNMFINLLGLNLHLVDGLGWLSCVCIWYISTWFSRRYFATQQSETLVKGCFRHAMCAHVGCRDVCPQTDVVQQDAPRLTILDVWHCSQDSIASVYISLRLFRFSLWKLIIWQCSMISIFFAAFYQLWKVPETLGWNKSKKYLLWLMNRVRCEGPKRFVLKLMQ